MVPTYNSYCFKMILFKKIHYTNYICIAGRGEPLLCKNILDIIETIVVHKKRFYMHTNGDFIHKYIDDLDSLLNLSNTDEGNKPKILLNCYDGVDQWKQFTELYGHFKGIDITYDRRDDDKDYVEVNQDKSESEETVENVS